MKLLTPNMDPIAGKLLMSVTEFTWIGKWYKFNIYRISKFRTSKVFYNFSYNNFFLKKKIWKKKNDQTFLVKIVIKIKINKYYQHLYDLFTLNKINNIGK